MSKINDTSNTHAIVSEARAREFAAAALEHAGVSAPDAATVAHGVVLADQRGAQGQGLNLLVRYIGVLRGGGAQVSPGPQIVQKTPVMASIDGQRTLGMITATLAVDKCIEMAEGFGVGIAAVKNSGHFGMAGLYALRAMEKGFAAMVFSNSSPAMAPWGGKEKLWGTNPLAVGFPGGLKGDFLLDMSCTMAARSTVRRYAKNKESTPRDWMLDADGLPTQDPNEGLKGSMLPAGGPRGAGLAAVTDILSGLISGALFAGSVGNALLDPTKMEGTGHWIMVFKPDVFLDSREEYLERMDRLVDRIHSCELAPGALRILVPGERGTEQQRATSKDGIQYTKEEISRFHEAAESVGCKVKLT